MKEIFEEDETEAVILVDASNAFNRLNRNIFIHNIKILCPEIATYIINSYKNGSRLFIVGGSEITSNEGTTQGDSIAMATYALGILPLLTLIETPGIKHVAFADDISSAGSISSLKSWWGKIVYYGPLLGYYPNASKSWLISKPNNEKQAFNFAEKYGLKETVKGRKHLGAVIGTTEFKEDYINTIVKQWVLELEKLSEIATSQNEAAYAAFVRVSS